jgi:hypothetical protein
VTTYTPAHGHTLTRTSPRLLLPAGAFAGPLYVLAGAAQVLTRPGFDLSRHALSLLANGEWGWVQIANFILTGLLTLAGAVGLRRALAPGRGQTWGPILLAVYGLSLIAAGVFTADPALGFPPGTPQTGTPVSWHGLLHFVFGAAGFLAFIAAALIFARRFAGQGQRGWAAFSALTGLLFFGAFFGIAAGGGLPLLNITFTAAVILAWSWLTALALHTLRVVPA